jgi:hypothetical protein
MRSLQHGQRTDRILASKAPCLGELRPRLGRIALVAAELESVSVAAVLQPHRRRPQVTAQPGDVGL